jgi:hypothetical protein
MLRKLLVLVALLIGTGILLADEAVGKFKAYEKGKLTITDKDKKDHDFKLAKETSVFDGDTEVKGKDRGKLWKGLSDKDDVTVTFEKDDVKKVMIKKAK